MKEADWLKAKDGEAMLALVAPHLSARQWNLLAAMFVRRLGKLLAEPGLNHAVQWVEQHAGALATAGGRLDVQSALSPAIEVAARQAQSEQRAIVALANPDALPEEFQHVEGRKTNASAPLFQAAADYAQRAIASAGEAATEAGAAVARLLEGVASAEQLQQVRRLVVGANQELALSGLHVSSALKLKALGDESADRDTGREVGKRYAAALSTVEREEEFAGYRANDIYEQKVRSDHKALGPLVQELCGNVCRPAVLQRAWLTTDVVALAQSFESDRTPERMLILRDALLDAGCDNWALLRHLRGMQEDKDESLAAPHAAGCWVIDAILQRESAFRGQLPLGIAKKTRGPKRQ